MYKRQALKDLDRDTDYRDALLGADIVITDSALMVMVWNFIQRDSLRRLSGLKYLRELVLQPDVRQARNALWIMASPASAATNIHWLSLIHIYPCKRLITIIRSYSCMNYLCVGSIC